MQTVSHLAGEESCEGEVSTADHPGVQRQHASFLSDRRFKAGKQILKVLCYQWRGIPGVSKSSM